VGITANCDSVSNISAIIIGAVAGILVVVGIKLLDMLKIDDPVGAWPVHGLNGIWGGIATGIFGSAAMPGGAHSIVPQIVGSIVIPVWAFATMFILFYILKLAGLLRVSRSEELRGLDIGEHGEEAYNGFQIFTID
jgi:Amt family ammonium transporter